MMSRQPTDLKKDITEAINKLDKETLWSAIKIGREGYFFDFPVSDSFASKGRSILKSLGTLGMADFFRDLKAEWRLPTEEEITNENAKEKLKNFLLGGGNKDLQSLKYHVVSALLNYTAKTNHAAAEMIDLTLEALGHKPSLQVGIVSKKMQKDMEEKYDEVFTLK